MVDVPPGGVQSARWTLVLPFKGGPNAKSRLSAPAGLATAIALDCLDAVLAAAAVGEVVVVTAEPGLARSAARAGAVVRTESRPGAGLLAAIEDGLRGLQGPCGVLLGDLPALRPNELDSALKQAEEALTTIPAGAGAAPSMAFVPDADNVGTVLLAALGPAAMRPAFGPDSARRHAGSGALRLDLDLPSLRRDVDTQADLTAATELGLGPRTWSMVLEGSRPGSGPGRDPS